MNAQDLIARLGSLHAAAVSDVLDQLGLRRQVLSPGIQPVAGIEALVGTAFPVQAVRTPVTPEDHSYNQGIMAVDSVPAGAVVVIATGECFEAASWGELLATRARARGAVGVITDGAIRDLDGLRRLRFPAFAAARNPQDAQGRLSVLGFGEPVICGGVAVSPGDLVLADPDGIVVTPAELAEEVVRVAEEKRAGEDAVRSDLENGASAAEVFARHGIL